MPTLILHPALSFSTLFSSLPASPETPVANAVWKGHLTFGLITIPVRLFTAARSERISFNQLHEK